MLMRREVAIGFGFVETATDIETFRCGFGHVFYMCFLAVRAKILPSTTKH
jgi:hypothetical protein